jgi:hypothetical protein
MTLPHVPESEAVIVAAHLEAPQALDPADLYSPSLREVWHAVDRAARPVDAVLLARDLLGRKGHPPTMGWAALLRSLVEEVPAVADMAPHLEAVRATAHQRRLGAVAQAVVAEARGVVPDVAAWAEDVAARLVAVSPRAPQRVSVVQGEALAAPVPPVDWLCEALQLAPGRPSMLSGYGGAGKTMLACSLALSLASGQRRAWDAVDLQRCGPVRHLNWEMHEDSLRHRYQRLAMGMGVDLAASGLGLCSRRQLAGLTLTSSTVVRDLALLLDGCAMALLDSFRAAVPGVDENSSEVRRYLDVLLEVTELTGCVCLVIHHLGKSSPDPRLQRDPVQLLRGSSGINDALDTSWCVLPGEHSLRVTQGKVSRAQRAEDLEVQIVDLPTGGLTVTHMPPEQIAQLARIQDPDAAAEVSIIEALRKHGPQSQTTLESGSKLGVIGSRQVRRRVLAKLVADTVVSSSGAGPARRFWVL